MVPEAPTRKPQNFNEETFYLREFYGRTLALAAASEPRSGGTVVKRVLNELGENQTGVLLLVRAGQGWPELAEVPRLVDTGETLAGRVWRTLRESPAVVLEVQRQGFTAACHRIALSLRVRKLVWLHEEGGLKRADGSRASFVDLEQLESLRGAGPPFPGAHGLLLSEIERALREGLPEVNLCTSEGLAEELFSYEGSGTLFTRRRYLEVRALGLDDFAVADNLISRGVQEGYLAPRSREQRDEVLAHAAGAFVEGVSLAGLGALLRWGTSGEIACLYALTRYLGEGVGGHLVASLSQRSMERGDAALFACTTHSRSAAFFERNGFERVAPERLPPEKWRDYPAERRSGLICLRERRRD